MSGSALSLRNVTVRLGHNTVLEDFNLEVAAGERLVLAGPSGSGKSTLLRAIAGLIPISAGEIRIAGRPVQHLPPGQRAVGMVFQQAALLPHLSVLDNLTFGLRARGMRKSAAVQRARDVAGWLEISALLERRPRALSGGEQQRVALGRALLREGGLILLDEPLSQLDAPLRARLREELLRVHGLSQATMLHVTHDQHEAMALGDRIGILEHGRLLQLDPPHAIYAQPHSAAVARFIGSPGINLIPLARQGDRWHWGDHLVPGPATEGRALQLGIRPEHLKPSDDPTAWPVTLKRREILGERELWYLSGHDDLELVASQPLQPTPPPATLRITADFDQALYFEPGDGRRIPA